MSFTKSQAAAKGQANNKEEPSRKSRSDTRGSPTGSTNDCSLVSAAIDDASGYVLNVLSAEN
jgi:hypothetical protein